MLTTSRPLILVLVSCPSVELLETKKKKTITAKVPFRAAVVQKLADLVLHPSKMAKNSEVWVRIPTG